jgi:hypothetical protein
LACCQVSAGSVAAQPRHGLVHALVVELDALALRALLAVPVGALEARLGPGARLAEEPVVAVEAFEHRACDGEGAAVGELVGEHGCVRAELSP